MDNFIKNILREDWNDREYHAAETYMNYKDEVLGELIYDILKNRTKNLKQKFELAPIGRINKLWSDYSKTGFVRDEAGIDMIGEIFVRNIAMLAVNTELSGHSERDPKHILQDYDDTLTPRQIKRFVDSDKFYDYIQDYNGQLRISDYGLPRLEKLAWKFLSQDKTYEEKLITLDMILNVVHQRSDLSRLFVQGGSDSLDMLFTNESSVENLEKAMLNEDFNPQSFVNGELIRRTKELLSYVKDIAEDMAVHDDNHPDSKHIKMSSDVDGADELSGLLHQIVHEVMHWKKSSKFFQHDVKDNQPVQELQAETVAFLVMKHYALPVEHHPVYFKLWQHNKEKIMADVKLVANVADYIVELIDHEANTKNPAGQDLYL